MNAHKEVHNLEEADNDNGVEAVVPQHIVLGEPELWGQSPCAPTHRHDYTKKYVLVELKEGRTKLSLSFSLHSSFSFFTFT